MRTDAPVDRRHFLAYFSAMGFSGSLFPGVLWARLQQEREITKQMVAEAEKVAGLEFTDAQREEMLRGLNQNARAYAQLRNVALENAVPPAIQFDPVLPGMEVPSEVKKFRPSKVEKVRRPANFEEAAFWPVTHLAELVRTRQVTAAELTRMYLDRLKRYGEKPLEAVVTLTEERAIEQAARADQEIRRGRYRGPLHGIPWGAKDLLAVKGYRTTWGAKPYESQVIEEDATVVRRLDEAGAVLVAKLTLGALAQGDVWYGGMTRNPWKLDQGSSGSSAGPAAATVAGLVGFAIGSETLGSIVSPSTRTGATGLRPTFGRVSRHGAMALAWSMDKIGPLCRSVEDCALVLRAIQGPDGKDPAARDVPFNWDANVKPADLRIGLLKSAFEAERENKAFDDAALEVLRSLGAKLTPFELPADYPVAALRFILSAEAGAAFGGPALSGELDTMERSSWPNTFRQARFIPAVEYIQANRVRTLLMRAMHQAMKGFDVVVAPSFAQNLLLLTNLTGHPTVVLPNGFTPAGTPVSLSFVGKLWGEAEALALARAYQDATGFHLKQPAGLA
ncbi:MAG: amidase [Gemmatimonadetes bacterium]|nr:amidase [Gemmatimonadota bacterium]